MAISKVKPIKKSLKKAIDYIVNPEKTDGGRLVSSFGCSPMTADIEMKMTADKARNKSERLAYHMIQSFSPDDDITPEKAHELGKEFAERMLEGKYEYVISTHIDKDHLHNHIIFNATSFVDFKKYHMPVWHKYRMFNVNDKICRDNNLSVIEMRSDQKGKSWYQSKDGKSWREKLKIAIDNAIYEAASYEEFIRIMEMEGYEYKETAKTLSFTAVYDGQKKSTRVSKENYGEYYTKEMLLKRIADKEFDQSINKNQKAKKPKREKQDVGRKTFCGDKRINLIVDISQNIKAQQSKGYEHALVMANINTMVKTMNYLQQNGLTTLEDLSDRLQEANTLLNDMKENQKNMENERKRLSEKIKFSQNYVKYKKIAAQAKREPAGSEFLKIHKDEILLFNVAAIYMETNGIDTSYLDIRQMIAEHKEYLARENMVQPELKKMREKVRELETIRKNVEQILNKDITIDSEKQRMEKEEKIKKEHEAEM